MKPLAGIRAVVFDLDGTLTGRGTTYRGRLVALIHAALASPAGRRLQAGGRPTRLALLRLFRHRYDVLCRRVVLDPATSGALDTLRNAGILLGIVTNGTKRKRHTVTLLGLDRRAACIVISGELGRRKPDRADFDAVIACLGVPPDASLFVGNQRRQDIDGARDAGMPTVWWRRGRRSPVPWRRDPQADRVISSPRELLVTLGLAPTPSPR
jgi:HAD superfamily hydrolase (TIGR01509 family)